MASPRRYPRGSWLGIAPDDLVLYLVLANALLFAGWFWSPVLPILNRLALWPIEGIGLPFRPWQLLTYGFLHSPNYLAHIGFNMFAVWMFGRQLAHDFGSGRFLVYYMVCMVGAGLVQLVVSALTGNSSPTVGASGSVFGLLLAFGMLHPNRTLMLLFFPVPIKAKYFVVLYGIAELALGISSPNSSVAHFAHLGGMVTGFLLLKAWLRR